MNKSAKIPLSTQDHSRSTTPLPLATSSGFQAFPAGLLIFQVKPETNYMYNSMGLTTTGYSHHLFSHVFFTDWCGRGSPAGAIHFFMWNFIRSSKFPLSLAISQVWSFHHTTKVHAVTEWFCFQNQMCVWIYWAAGAQPHKVDCEWKKGNQPKPFQ